MQIAIRGYVHEATSPRHNEAQTSPFVSLTYLVEVRVRLRFPDAVEVLHVHKLVLVRETCVGQKEVGPLLHKREVALYGRKKLKGSGWVDE